GARSAGLIGMALVWAILYPLVNVPALYLGLRTLSLSFLGWLDALKPAAIASAAMAVAVFGGRAMTLQQSPWVRVTGGRLVAALVYAAVLWFGFRSRVLEIFRVIKSVRSRQRPSLAQA